MPSPSIIPRSSKLLQAAQAVKTKIIATVGPAVASAEKLRELVIAGVDVFRLNFAHGTHEWLEGIINSVRQISVELDRPVGLLGDLAGPKIRLEEIPGGMLRCEFDMRIEFVRTADPARPERLTSTYDRLVDEVAPGDRVLLADGIVSLRVTEKHPEEGRIVCTVEQPGVVRSRQGINLPGVVLSVPSLTEKDLEDLKFACLKKLDFVGLSFVRSANDIMLLRQSITELNLGHAPQIVAKIEKMEAVSDIDRIIDATDAVMVARGDLGVEVDLALVPVFQKRIIQLCNQSRTPVITATQMLDSMQHSSRPTRAEVSDVANSVLDGTDAVMLSGETAVGEYPAETVSTMNHICHEAERLLLPAVDVTVDSSEARTRALAVTEAVTHGAVVAARQLAADLIVVCTHSGRTALAVSRLRGSTQILGLTDNETTARRMSLYWGVTPLFTPVVNEQPQKLLKFVVEWGMRHGLLRTGSKLVLVASSNWSADGHDMLLVHSIS